MTTNHLEIKMKLGQDVFLNNWRKYCYLEKGLRQKQTGVKLIVLVRFASSVICVLPQSEDKCLYAFCMPPSSMCLPILASVQSFILRCWYSHIHCTCQHVYTNSVLEGKSLIQENFSFLPFMKSFPISELIITMSDKPNLSSKRVRRII